MAPWLPALVLAATLAASPSALADDAFSPETQTPSLLAWALALVGAAALVDHSLYDLAHFAHIPGVDPFFRDITHLGDGATAALVAAALWKLDPEASKKVARASVRAGLATWVLKTAVARPRPYEDPASCASHWFSVSACVSFPSGHTSTAFAVARVLAEEYPERKWLWYALALLVSWSRVETGDHWPSDVVAGALLGLWAAESVLND